MTWWMIVLAVVGYIVVGGLVGGIACGDLDDDAMLPFFYIFWPIALLIQVFCLLAYLPHKLGEWIYDHIINIF